MNVQAQLAAAAKQRYKQMNGIGGSPPSPSGSPKLKDPIVTGADPSASQAARKAAAAALAAKMGKSSSTPAPPPAPKGPPPKKINSSRASALSSSLAKKKKVSPAPAVAGTASPRAPGGPLSDDEEEIASQYRKMMKVGMPEGAVRHKMELDGVAGHIVEAVFSGGASQSTPRNGSSSGAASSSTKQVAGGGGRAPSLSPEEEKIASQYRKMMKIGMPEGAVRHKMNLDGVSCKIQDAVIAGEATASPPPSEGRRGGSTAASSLSADEEKVASQYRKMMKIGMPEGAVRHKMNLDGVSAKIQDAVIAGEASPPPTSSASVPSGGGGKRSSLGPDEENIADQYRKMMKIGMPEGAVRHKMNMDGVSVKVQNSVLAGEVAASGSSSVSKPPSSSQRPGAGQNFSSLSAQDEQIASQYRRMMKVGMPEGALRHKMNMDGVSSMIQDSVIAGEVPNPNAAPDANDEAPIRPVNPMAAAIAASQGIGSLKKATPIERDDRDVAPRRSSNPLAAAIAASGGQSSLKKASANARQQNLQPPKPHSTNSVADELAASGFKNSLKKTQNRAPLEPPKPRSTDSMASAIAASGFQNSLRKTTPQKMHSPSETSSGDSQFAHAISEERKLKPPAGGQSSGTKKPQNLPTTNSEYDADSPSMLEKCKGTVTSRPPIARTRSNDSTGKVSIRAAPSKASPDLPKKVVPAVENKAVTPQQKTVVKKTAVLQQKTVVRQEKTAVLQEKTVVLQEKMVVPNERPMVPEGKPEVLKQKPDVAIPPKSVPTSSSYIAAMVENRKAMAGATLATAPAQEEVSPKEEESVGIEDARPKPEPLRPAPREQIQEKPDAVVATEKGATSPCQVLAPAPVLDVGSPKDEKAVKIGDPTSVKAQLASPAPAPAQQPSTPPVTQPKKIKTEPEVRIVASKFTETHGGDKKSNGTIVEKEKSREIETATTVQKVKELGNGHQEVVVATATVTTDGITSSAKRTRERKRKPKDSTGADKRVDDGVDHHCACIVM